MKNNREPPPPSSQNRNRRLNFSNLYIYAVASSPPTRRAIYNMLSCTRMRRADGSGDTPGAVWRSRASEWPRARRQKQCAPLCSWRRFAIRERDIYINFFVRVDDDDSFGEDGQRWRRQRDQPDGILHRRGDYLRRNGRYFNFRININWIYGFCLLGLYIYIFVNATLANLNCVISNELFDIFIYICMYE